jgi:predicted PurR-regulated permease PerM
LALAFGLLERGFPIDWTVTVIYPTLVYAISQSLETFVITPLVQGSYTRMHPLAVLAALICGASVGGVFGILVAIPLMASGKIILHHVVKPAATEAAARS